MREEKDRARSAYFLLSFQNYYPTVLSRAVQASLSTACPSRGAPGPRIVKMTTPCLRVLAMCVNSTVVSSPVNKFVYLLNVLTVITCFIMKLGGGSQGILSRIGRKCNLVELY